MADRSYEAKKKWRENNREKDRECKMDWQKKNKEKHNKANKNYRENHPEIINAHSKSQRIILGSFCMLCGSKEKLEKHHPDYSIPKFIITLCKECHTKIHRR